MIRDVFTIKKGNIMIIKSLGLIALLSLASIFTKSVTAAENLLCDNCTSTEMRTMAISNGNGPVHIIDPLNGIIKKYYISHESSYDFGPGAVFATPMIPDPHKAMLVEEAYEALTYAKGIILTHDIIVPTFIANSAWELTGSNVTQNAVVHFLNNSTTFGLKMAIFANNTLSMIPAFPTVPITVRVRFNDLSYVDLKQGDYIDSGHFEYEGVRAREWGSHGNDIPLEEEGLVGDSDEETGPKFEFIDADDNPNLATFTSTGSHDRVFIRIPPGIPSASYGSGWIATVTCSKANGVTKCTTRYIRKK